MARDKEGFGPPKPASKHIIYLELHNKHVPLIYELNRQLTQPFRFALMPNPSRPTTKLQVYTDQGWTHTIFSFLEDRHVPYSVNAPGVNSFPTGKSWDKHMRIIDSHDGSCALAFMTAAEAEVYPLEHQYDEWCRKKTLDLIQNTS